MFTGLIQDIGTIRSIDKKTDWRIVIECGLDLGRIEIGASIACSGCCLTVVEKNKNTFTVDVSSESLSKTIIKNWGEGTKINLETSLKMGDELGGHFVFGHVDGQAKVADIKKEGDSYRLKISVSLDLSKFIAPKGSISLEGVSLTVNEVEDNSFGVMIIPHTWEKTTLSQRKIGDDLNIEIDMLARYVARVLGK